jgi:hypothetical protein
MYRSALASLLAAAPLIIAGDAAFAYVGPGAGITAIGTVLALVGAALLAIVGFVWYPLKRLLGRKQPADHPASAAAPRQE